MRSCSRFATVRSERKCVKPSFSEITYIKLVLNISRTCKIHPFSIQDTVYEALTNIRTFKCSFCKDLQKTVNPLQTCQDLSSLSTAKQLQYFMHKITSVRHSGNYMAVFFYCVF